MKIEYVLAHFPDIGSSPIIQKKWIGKKMDRKIG